MSTITELVVDAYGCRSDLNDIRGLEKAARTAAESVGALVAESVTHRFQPHGATVCLILKESHLIISTWPEHSLAIVNVFLCNPEMDAEQCWKSLSGFLKPSRCAVHRVEHRLAAQSKAA